MAPSQLAITTSSINRLLKEESSYRTELSNQQKRLETLGRGVADEADEGNSDFQLKQEVSLLKPPYNFLSFVRDIRPPRALFSKNFKLVSGLDTYTFNFAHVEASYRRNESGIWTIEGKNCSSGGEGGRDFGEFSSLFW